MCIWCPHCMRTVPEAIYYLVQGWAARSVAVCRSDLLKIVDLVRGQLTKLQRATLGALVVMDVHARDVVTALAAGAVSSQSDFDWQAQLRSYWVEDPAGEKGNTIMMHMMSAELEFGCAPHPLCMVPAVYGRCLSQKLLVSGSGELLVAGIQPTPGASNYVMIRGL